MTVLRAGLRSRFVLDSARIAIVASLDQGGWFDVGRAHAPIQFAFKPQDWDAPIAYNTFAISSENDQHLDGGLGNQPATRSRIYVDFWAENDAIGTHFAYDVRDILCAMPELDIWNLSQDPPTIVTTVDVDQVRVDRTTGFPREWHRHWFVTSFWIDDDYLDESATADFSDVWTSGLQDARDRVTI